MNAFFYFSINQIIKADLGFKEALKDFQGRVIEANIEGFSPFFIRITKDGQVEGIEEALSEIHIDLSLTGRPVQLLTYAKDGFPANANDYEIYFSKDLKFARELFLCIKGFRVDWERLISKISHEQIGTTLTAIIPKIAAKHTQNKKVLGESITAFLQSELKLLPSAKQCLDFEEEVTLLRQDVDRFEAKLNAYIKAQHDN